MAWGMFAGERIMKNLIIILIALLQLGCSKKENTMDNSQKMHHYLGIEMNMQTWNLLTKKNRNDQDDTRMVYFAKASNYHWKESPQFEPINEQRGEWLISHVYAVLGHGENALDHAQSCMNLTKKHAFKDFDLAYAYEGMARAYAALNNSTKMEKYFLLAKEAGDSIQSEEDKKMFFSDLHNGPWYECLKTED